MYQVINALRHQRLVHTHTFKSFTYNLGDQRLTASKVSTLNNNVSANLNLTVINALRHQRLVHN
ncbi:hypothetical protein MICAG_2500003 [Microcystis aeruginosa PCC 9808]|uniref:Uncharacterized protein n=1 Tax=Microcystis aeruginosa PCC 9808 TaxID=1160284 RepID=I4HRG1_MICAE|nr:hypothetical protein MICAG_2500003 [Microcystis aeruginosa PCC 9808]